MVAVIPVHALLMVAFTSALVIFELCMTDVYTLRMVHPCNSIAAPLPVAEGGCVDDRRKERQVYQEPAR